MRGEVVWVDLEPVRGAEVPKVRPAIVVSRGMANRVLATVTVVPLSSVAGRQRDRLVQPLLGRRDTRLPKDSRALCDQVRTVDRSRLRLTGVILDAETMARVGRGLLLHLGLDRPGLR